MLGLRSRCGEVIDRNGVRPPGSAFSNCASIFLAKDEPCGWMNCFNRCQPKSGTCDRNHDLVGPAQLKAALKANCTEKQAARFSA